MRKRTSKRQRKPTTHKDEPLSKELRERITGIKDFAHHIDVAATAALKQGYVGGAGSLFYQINTALEDLAKSISYPSAHEIFRAAHIALGHAIYRVQNESEIYQRGQALAFFMDGPTVGRLSDQEERKAVSEWGERWCRTEFLFRNKNGKTSQEQHHD